ncbi:hypothetical protein NE172_13965 [Clostridium botulinum]|uniref:Uncharacterized protein n=1 Tax=Clostridium botulinum TaxID=1491 RepID=A0A6B4JLC0_CLOBO|nr:hypothetical protein [Clostridium botulinum]EES48872.1 hypothetical protein CLO_2157 [Clostridium botulinum E1 str. 'BoNT E Beluga']MBY6761137.1 hypothetical protein [Clostridium botulinum]MBY6921385.1 hypothetical protein [Clostridium botulinum]MCR1132045.1 hypothetical protein [Clostridium botulinum]NFJ57818.1 hypothetical protein [Clostridium botulinum]
MAFSFSGLVSAVVGAVAKVATAVVNKLSPVAKSGGILGGIAGAIVGVAEAVLGVTAEFANACEDGEIDDEEAEELLEDVFKLVVGVFIFPFGSVGAGSSGGENEDGVFNIFGIQPKLKYETKGSVVDEYLCGDSNSLFNSKIVALNYNSKAEAKFGLFEYKKEYEKKPEKSCSSKFNLGVEEEFKTFEISAGMKQVGDKYLGASGEISTTAYSEKVELGIEIGKDEETGKINCKGKAGAIATLHSAKAEEKFTILGFEICVEEEGHLGAVGAEAEIGLDQGKLKVKAKAAAILGIGVSVSVGLAD